MRYFPQCNPHLPFPPVQELIMSGGGASARGGRKINTLAGTLQEPSGFLHGNKTVTVLSPSLLPACKEMVGAPALTPSVLLVVCCCAFAPSANSISPTSPKRTDDQFELFMIFPLCQVLPEYVNLFVVRQ